MFESQKQQRPETFKISKQVFMSPRIGNIKEAYYFNKRIGEGSFGTMYHA